MAYRFTNTDKWSDSWFSNLNQIEMLLFMYLCDNCDIAGFAEVNYKRWAVDLNSDPSTMQGALMGLKRGILISSDGECVYVKNFLRHQKNLPINPNNRAHIGIIKRFDIYKHKFDIQDINKFIESPIDGASMGHQSPTGIGIGIGIGNYFSLLLSFLEKQVNLLPIESASDSRTFHDAVYGKLVSAGYDCSYEYVIPNGRIDILVRLADGTNVAIELDNRTPRGRNLMKVEDFDYKIISILRDPYLDKSYQQFNVDGLILYRGFEEKEEPKPKRFNFRKAMISYGFREDLVDEWMKVRKAKKSVNTEKSFDDFIQEVEKTSEDKNTLLEFIAVKKQWRGFQAKWLAEFASPNEKLLTYEEAALLVTQNKAIFADFDKKEIDGVMYWIPKKDLK